jgi:hypothetical protein
MFFKGLKKIHWVLKIREKKNNGSKKEPKQIKHKN